MAPVPNRTHQDLAIDVLVWLRACWARPRHARVHAPVNLALPGGWPHDYRIADLVLLTPDRFHIDHDEYFEGPPAVVVEIRSPGDDTYEKLPFYARLGVPEVWVIDRDTRRPELYRLNQREYQTAAPDADGWLHSPATDVRFRAEPGGKLAVQMGDDESTRQSLPE